MFSSSVSKGWVQGEHVEACLDVHHAVRQAVARRELGSAPDFNLRDVCKVICILAC